MSEPWTGALQLRVSKTGRHVIYSIIYSWTMPKISTFATPEQLTGIAYTNITGTFRRNLSAAAWMDYTSPATAQMSEPRTGASCWAVDVISECNSYMPQHLDSLPVPVICIYAVR